MNRAIVLLMLVATFPVYAETAYVTERLPIVLRAALAEGSPVVKTVDGGASLEVLERAERFARVRDAQGAEGWIESRFLVATPPARAQLERAQADLAKAQARIGELDAKLAQEPARAAEPAKPSANPPTTMQAPSVDDNDFPWGWLVLAFAMLWIGFGAGIVWLRERHRKKLGGMYLRV